MVVSRGVRLYTSKELFVEARRLGLLAEQQFAGAVRAFDSCPHMVALGKLQRRFRQVAISDLPALQCVIAAPQER